MKANEAPLRNEFANKKGKEWNEKLSRETVEQKKKPKMDEGERRKMK